MDKHLPLPPLLILCAGSSTRMGSPKGLIKIKNETLLEYQINNFSSTGDEKIIVVLGAHLEAYQKQLPWLIQAQNAWHKFEYNQVKAVINPDFEQGQFSSLQTGLKEFIHLKENFIFILPIDVPIPDEDVLYRMLTILNRHHYALIPELFERGGHPVLISKDFARHLITLDPLHPDSRLDRQIELLDPPQKARIGVGDPGIHLNLNNEEQLKRFLANLQS